MTAKSMNASQKGIKTRFLKGVGRVLVLADIAIVS